MYMNLNRSQLILVLALVFTIALIGLTFLPQAARSPVTNEEVATVHFTLSIEGYAVQESLAVTGGTTLLSALRTLDAQDATLRLTTEKYQDMGTLVTGMNGLMNGADNKYWQYSVNGVMPLIGADAHVLQEGDVVEWSFGESEM